MTARPDYTMADAARDLRHRQRDPAAQAYGNYLRRQGALPALDACNPYDREAERVRLFGEVCRANARIG